MEESPQIRHAVAADLPAIVTIYNQAVAQRGATADLAPISVTDRQSWFEAHSPSTYPIWVIENQGHILGWCSLSAYRPGRQALRYTAEISYYIAQHFQGQGLGSRLMAHAIEAASNLGFRALFALLLEVNHGSIALLKKFGFVQWGLMPNVADIQGQTCSHLIYGRSLYP